MIVAATGYVLLHYPGSAAGTSAKTTKTEPVLKLLKKANEDFNVVQ